LNYFNYFTEIEDTFVRRRGRHLLLSPMDWALIESWKEMGVPLHVALRGIERAFDSFDSKPRRRSVKSLLYCQEEVEAQYAEWRDGQVGADPASDNGEAVVEKSATDSSLPFPRSEIQDHLQQAVAALQNISAERTNTAEAGLSETVSRVASRLDELLKDFGDAAQPNAEKLEDSLTSLDKMLDEAVRASVSPQALEAAISRAGEQLEPYRSRMEPAVFAKTQDNLLLKQLRDAQGMPRLSLFYL
jgi:ElaB/YqjD/DUF883 family membrane-anchored ribosome-binding protein